MLQINNRTQPVFPREPEARIPLFDFGQALEFFLKNRSRIIGSALLFMLLGVFYIVITPARYTSTALILIDQKRAQIGLSPQSSGFSDPGAAVSAVESQVEVLQSDTVLLSAIRKLDLTRDPEFRDPPTSIIGRAFLGLTRIFVSADATSQEELERSTLRQVANNLKVRRLGLTFVLEASYTAYSREKAAEVVNAIADAYITDELEAKYAATKRAGAWLQDRIAELREQTNAADRLVQEYKTKNNIIDTNRGQMIDQQISEQSSQLIVARTQAADAKARLDRINEILRVGGAPEGTVTDALKSDVVTKLRQQLLDLQKREAEWSRRYGANHQAVINLRSEMSQVQRSLDEELRRISETFKSDYEISKTRLDSTEASVKDLVARAAEVRQAEIKLRELETSAQVFRTLYESFLQRFTEATQQQSFPIAEARVITPGSPPLGKSWPKGSIVLLGATFLGGIMGVGYSLLLTLLDSTFRTPADVESLTGFDCISSIPLAKASTAPRSSTAMPELPPPAPDRLIASKVGLMRHVFDAPFSAFAESIRAMKISLDLKRSPGQGMVVGIISSVPTEGKSMVATNLAQIIGQSGQRCILVDCDLRRPSLTRWLAPDSKTGLIDIIYGRTLPETHLFGGGWSRFDFLPCAGAETLSNTDDILSSDAARQLVEYLSARYDYVILDLPPIAPLVDANALAPSIDHFMFIIEWGKTDRSVVIQSLNQMPEQSRDKMLGAVLNKVDTRQTKNYSTGYDRYYNSAYHSHYSS